MRARIAVAAPLPGLAMVVATRAPDLDVGGLGLSGRLKLLAPDIKVIVTSGHPAVLNPAVDGLQLARRAGADIALAKPLSTDALRGAVREVLSTAGVDRPGAPVHVTDVNGRQRPASEFK